MFLLSERAQKNTHDLSLKSKLPCKTALHAQLYGMCCTITATTCSLDNLILTSTLPLPSCITNECIYFIFIFNCTEDQLFHLFLRCGSVFTVLQLQSFYTPCTLCRECLVFNAVSTSYCSHRASTIPHIIRSWLRQCPCTGGCP